MTVPWQEAHNFAIHVRRLFAFLKTINAFKKQLKIYFFENIIDAYFGNGFIACCIQNTMLHKKAKFREN